MKCKHCNLIHDSIETALRCFIVVETSDANHQISISNNEYNNSKGELFKGKKLILNRVNEILLKHDKESKIEGVNND